MLDEVIAVETNSAPTQVNSVAPTQVVAAQSAASVPNVVTAVIPDNISRDEVTALIADLKEILSRYGIA